MPDSQAIMGSIRMDAANRTGLSLVIPAFNEAAVIARAITEAETALAAHFGSFEVLIVDDGSADTTAAEVSAALPSAPHTRLLRHESNRGYGAALRTGFEAARFELVAFTDADCQFDLTELAQLADLAANTPVVVGYRADRKDPWRRQFLSWGYNVMARALLGTRVRDVDCALKVFHRAALAELLPESRGFFVNTEMMTRARQQNLPVTEVPVTHRPRAGGESKVSLREVPRTARKLFAFWWQEVIRGATPTVTPAVFQTKMSAPQVIASQDHVPDLLSPRAPQVAPPARHRAAA
ncbi:membrane protein containing glycosyl family 2 domain protein : Membrane protein containing Glycosyl transferase, family 2 domain protein OS=Rhodopirellula sp. SWK7 GN=RRSWK_06213 PE=4 SV=1: Glycos_transf_2 [Gemmata massiliana]|uniref:Glycosyltransferase 2-like domain-containing protein n=1 Tax=Gemmata massiliana TaxID=1210884 RepID=A0A6P2D6T7_9BACT|nr:membrane protein containing glycosyl family 2 domain protein : Membrane protein containing Glycosyl transferase, family 2 domain protein OS=Rhodopirellula sp. SWK7 GN=RRSWK_06213 PE=4 SV=1: Glycos_transf_2 [Gemmata massiliana]